METKQTEQTSSGRAWLCATIIIISGFLFGMMLKKIAGTMLLIMPALGVGSSAGGALVSAITIVSMIIAIPIGGIIVRFGARKVILLAFAFAIIGNVVGALSVNYPMLYVSRVIEGAGFGIFIPAAPSLLTSFFPPEKRGLPMGIWSTNVGAGAFLVLVFTNLVCDFNDPATWANMWWFIAVLMAVFGVLFFIFVKPPQQAQAPAGGDKPKVSVVEGFKSLPMWLLVLSFIGYTFGFIALTTFMPTYLNAVLGIDAATANVYTSVLTAAMIVGGFIAGFVLKRTKREMKPWLYVIFMVLSGVAISLSFVYGANMVIVFSVVGGIVMQFVPAILFNNAPDTAKAPMYVGAAMALISLCQNFGGFLSGNISGMIIENYGWMAMTYALIAASIIAVVLSILYARSMKAKLQEK